MMGKNEPVYQAIWAEPCDFDEVLISPVMIQDHMPDTMLKALNKVSLNNDKSKVKFSKPGTYEHLDNDDEFASFQPDQTDELPMNSNGNLLVVSADVHHENV